MVVIPTRVESDDEEMVDAETESRDWLATAVPIGHAAEGDMSDSDVDMGGADSDMDDYNMSDYNSYSDDDDDEDPEASVRIKQQSMSLQATSTRGRTAYNVLFKDNFNIRPNRPKKGIDLVSYPSIIQRCGNSQK